MKRTLSVLILFSLLAPAIGHFMVLRVQKYQVRMQVKREMIRGMAKEDLMLIALSLEERSTVLKWEHSGEFEYLGEMYDVVDTEESDDSVFYRVWWDHEETALNKQLSALVNDALQGNTGDKQQQIKLIGFYTTLFMEKVFHWSAQSTWVEASLFNPAQRPWLALSPEVPNPPPQAST